MLLFRLSFPVTIQIGNSAILLHTILEAAGIFLAFRYYLYLKKRKGDIIESDNRTWIIIAAAAGALIGSRLVGALESPHLLASASNKLLFIYQQKTIVGGLLGGLFAVELAKHFLREKLNTGDLFVYPLLLAIIVGRLGCFSMGIHEETYGVKTHFIGGMDLGDSQLRHPVTLYEIVFLVLLWICLRRVETKSALVNGGLFKLFMIAYLVFRLFLDFIKPHYTFPFGLSVIQLTCIAGLVWYSRYLLRPFLIFVKS